MSQKDNLIRRQAAIDAIANCTNCGDEKTLREYVAKHGLDNGWSGGVLEAIDAIIDLPSAQPYTEDEIQKIQDLEQAQLNKMYQLGYEDGMAERSWVPCNAKLPEESGRYLVTRGLNACGSLWNRIYIANYSDLMGIKSEKIWWQGNVGKSDFEPLNDVLAWMPLPECYRGEKE